jgi:hypothetical protein
MISIVGITYNTEIGEVRRVSRVISKEEGREMRIVGGGEYERSVRTSVPSDILLQSTAGTTMIHVH